MSAESESPGSVGSLAAFGFAEHTESEMSVEQAKRVAAFFDSPAIDKGVPLPLLWHWAFFTPLVRSADIGPDGHPRMAADSPTAGMPRRMWAGGQLHATGALRVGVPAERRSRVVSSARKDGRSGSLVIVTVEHEYATEGEVVIVERQDLIYRPGGSSTAEPATGQVEPAPSGGWAEDLVVDPVLLFRFSALTFNAHRIHYDRAYANDEEGYPGLVVHGPLTALLLAESYRRRLGDIRTFAFRATAPHFAGAALRLIGEPNHDGPDTRLRAIRCDGAVAMEATAG